MTEYTIRPLEQDLIQECIELLDNCILTCKKMTEITVSVTAQDDYSEECKEACEMCLQCCLECVDLFESQVTDCKDEACRIFFKDYIQLCQNVIKACGSVIRALEVDKDSSEECDACIEACDSFAEACERLLDDNVE